MNLLITQSFMLTVSGDIVHPYDTCNNVLPKSFMLYVTRLKSRSVIQSIISKNTLYSIVSYA